MSKSRVISEEESNLILCKLLRIAMCDVTHERSKMLSHLKEIDLIIRDAKTIDLDYIS